MKLYKHLASEFAESFLTGKSIRVGTLSDFRREEEHLVGIGDRFDASFERRLNFTADSSKDADIFRKLEEARIIKVDAGARVRINISDSYSEEPYPDLFLFCASETADTDFGYDAVIEISDFEAFARLLHGRMKALGLIKPEGLMGKVEYKKVNVEFLATEAWQASPFQKDLAFSENREWRIIFEPVVRPIQPRILDVAMPDGLLKRVR
ncbi:hypothetical protein [Sinorhizobium meliloti]|uniref:hypothetical protein n=1 Tax=Rhizobium meliloti TaxID=382 RepID=UPI003F14B814